MYKGDSIVYLHGTSQINASGHLEIGGVDTVYLAQRFGTPLYVVDETLVRQRCREFMNAFRESGLPFQVSYASKAFCIQSMCRLVEDEGLSLDVVSDGELYTALEAGFPAEKIHFHGNNKTPEEIAFALDARIGCFVVDNFTEITILDALSKERGLQTKVLIRITPGVQAHTHEFISTGQEDSKFGFNLSNGSAFQAVKSVLSCSHLQFEGIHSHIGSQIFEVEGFRMAATKAADFAVEIHSKLGVTMQVLNLGGGFGIRYIDEDRPLAVAEYVQAITHVVKDRFFVHDLPIPEIWIEPGRSIVGDAGTTLYTVGSIKDIPNVRKYVAVDGGMTDNPRPALYEAVYESILANKANEPNVEKVSIAGKCCESGDMLIWDIELPKTQPGDLLAVFCTGAYNYSMASNYNRIRRPAVVFVQDGKADLVVSRETYEDIVAHDIIPERLRKMNSNSYYSTIENKTLGK